MANEILQIAKTLLNYLNVTLLIVDMNLDMVIPLQHTPNPSAHVPSLLPPMFGHSALSNEISCLSILENLLNFNEPFFKRIFNIELYKLFIINNRKITKLSFERNKCKL